MTTKSLKCWKKYFRQIWDGHKRCEIRLNDRNFQVNEEYIIFETESFDEPEKYTGRKMKIRIKHIIRHDEINGLKDNYVIFSFIILGFYNPDTPID